MLRRLERPARAAVLRYVAWRMSDRERLGYQWSRDVDGDHTLRLDYPLCADDVVMDVGGYKGQFASDIHARFGCAVHVYEPVPEFARFIEGRFTFNQKVTTHAYGLGGWARQERINLSDDASSVVGAAGDRQTVEIRSAVDEIAGLGDIALLKLNIEGLEFEVLQALLDAGLLARVRFLQVQFHHFVHDAEQRRAELHRRIAQTHTLQWDYPFVWESWQRR